MTRDSYIQQDHLLGLGFEGSDERLTRDPDTGSVVSITDNGDKRYLLHDGQDSTLALLTPNEQITRRYRYDPDGHTTNRGTGTDTIIQWNGATNLENRGIYHFGHRLYNPATGRWTQPDPINQPADLTSANLYAYAGGDPINRSDPAGTISGPVDPCGRNGKGCPWRRGGGKRLSDEFVGNAASTTTLLVGCSVATAATIGITTPVCAGLGFAQGWKISMDVRDPDDDY